MLKTKGTVFPIRTDLGRQITCLFFSLSGKLLYMKYFGLFFTAAVSHRARAFDVSIKPVLFTKVFKRRDSLILN